MTEMLAKDFMTKDVVTVEIPSSRDDVLRILKRTGISGVPVVKGEEKKLLGIVTRKDILRKPEETQIALLMTSEPLTIEPETDIAEAARIMTEMRIRRLPVIDKGNLVGILSASDIISAVATMSAKSATTLSATRPSLSGKRLRCRLSAASWSLPTSMLCRS